MRATYQQSDGLAHCVEVHETSTQVK